MIMKNRFSIMCVLGLFVFASACSKYDFNDVNVKYDGEWAVPVLSTRLNFSDLIKDGGVIETDEEGFITMVYSNMNHQWVNASDYIVIPQQQASMELPFTIPSVAKAKSNIPLVVIPGNVHFELSNTEQVLNEVVFRGGEININPSFSSVVNVPVKSMKVRFVNLFESDGTTAVVSMLDFRNNNKIDLQNRVLTMSDNELKFNIELEFDNPSSSYSGESSNLVLDLIIDNIQYKSLRGYFGKLSFDYRDTILVSLFDSNIRGGSITLDKFKARAKFQSSIGAEISIKEQYFIALATDTHPEMTITGLNSLFTLEKPLSEGAFTVKDMVLESPSLTQAINDMYYRYVFEYNITVNPTRIDTDNYLFADSKIGASLSFELPMLGGINDLLLSDTMAFEVPQVDVLKKLSVNTYITNNFPIDISVQAYFLDDMHQVIRDENGQPITLFTNSEPLVKAGIVGEEWKVTAPTNTHVVTDIYYSTVQKLTTAKYLVLQATADSKGYNNSSKIKFYDTGFIDIKLGVKIQPNVEIGTNN